MRSSGWASLRLLGGVATRLHRSWEALPAEARRRWWETLVPGALGVLALTAALVWGARALESSGALGWERDAMRWMAAELPLSFSFAMWLEGPGNGFVLWALMLYASGVAAWTKRPLGALALILGYTLVYLPIAAGWWMWDRPRPEIILQGIASPGGAFRAFPSGHVVQAVFAYGLLGWFWIRSSPRPGERLLAAGTHLLVISAVAVGRLRIGAHWPSDVVAGAAIGFAWLAAVVVALDRAESIARPEGTRSAPFGRAAPR